MDFEEIDKRFTYHPPIGGQLYRYNALRMAGRTLADAVNSLCPESREKEIAITKLEEAVMWANAAIARRDE